jgi:3-isopropylmalate dehydratase small subunit
MLPAFNRQEHYPVRSLQVIAPSFGVFCHHSFKTGFLPIVRCPERGAKLRTAYERMPGARRVIDLEAPAGNRIRTVSRVRSQLAKELPWI